MVIGVVGGGNNGGVVFFGYWEEVVWVGGCVDCIGGDFDVVVGVVFEFDWVW